MLKQWRQWCTEYLFDTVILYSSSRLAAAAAAAVPHDVLTSLSNSNHAERPLLSTYCRPKNQISRRPILFTTCELKQLNVASSDHKLVKLIANTTFLFIFRFPIKAIKENLAPISYL